MTNANAPAGTADTATSNTTTANTGAAANASNSGAATGSANAGADVAASGATGQRYLQVGAFTSDEDAQPLREQLGALGFNVTRRQSGTGLVRLLVGPFGDAQIAQVQARLSDEGITDAFPVTP